MTATPFRQPFTSLQLELLDTFSRQPSVEDLFNIKILLSNYFAKKAMDEADRLWEERNYTQETMENWLENLAYYPPQ
jgi:hypothetical protein